LLTPADVRDKQFSTTRLRPGYDEGEVDAFLDEVEAELGRLIQERDVLRTGLAEIVQGGGKASLPLLSARPASAGSPSLTPADVRDKQFSTTRLRPGYDEGEVDAFLDEVEAELGRLIQERDVLRTGLAEIVQGGGKASLPSASAPPRGREHNATTPAREPSSDGFISASLFSPAALAGSSANPAWAAGSHPAQGTPADTPEVIEMSIRQGGMPGTISVEVVRSPVGEASTTVALDVDDMLARREQVQWAVLASSVASRRVLSETERPVREIGKMLFTALLGTGEVAGLYRSAAAVAADRGRRLQVVLRIDTPALAALPWEAMYDEATGAYVCRQDQLVRHVGAVSMPPPLRVQPPLRILGVVSSPRGLPPLDVEKEQDFLAHALARLVSQGLAEVHWVPKATWADLHSMLLEGPWHVVHYIGHGDFDPVRDEGILALVADNGRAHHVAAHRLVDLLRQASPMPRLIFLNSCAGAQGSVTDLFSGTAAALVRGGISSVAAMQYAISDQSAAAFARGFYTAIAHGRHIDDAVSSGRVAVLGTGDHTLEWLTPVLYMRGRDMQLFTTHS
jgi:DivIVA domain-containing protein